MAKRKTATRTGSAPGRRKARRKTAATRGAKRGRSVKKTTRPARRAASRKPSRRRAGGRKAASSRSTSAKGRGARRKPAGRPGKQQPRNVTAEVQRRRNMEEEGVPTPPSTLDLDRHASAASSGRAEMLERRRKHTAASPAITGGDVDADWEGAYFAGDESAGGDNPTPDQAAVEDIGRAVGVDYEDTEELKSTPKVEQRDKKRWELDPASSEDYKERNMRRS